MVNVNPLPADNQALRPDALAHIVLRTRNPDAMIKWYEDFLGAVVAFRGPRASFMQYDDEHHRIAIINLGPQLKDKSLKRAGVDHVSMSYNSLERLFEAYSIRKKKGILPHWCINHGMTMSMYYADPDGNVFENQVDTFATAEEAHEYMHSPEFVENPIGVDYDPEDIIARLKAGEDRATLFKRPPMGPRDASTIPRIPGPFDPEE